MNFLEELNLQSSVSTTENGAGTYTTTGDSVLNLFALGGSYRSRSEQDCISLFRDAFLADPVLAIKALFYIRDITDGQGERRFFRVAFKWLCCEYPEWANVVLEAIPTYGRWDDLFCTCGTSVESSMWSIIKSQWEKDLTAESPSLLAKWLPSENTSSSRSRMLAHSVRNMLGLTSRQYRKALSKLRERINVLERLMSLNKWEEINFSKIPSIAGMQYSSCFANRPETSSAYAAFLRDKNAKVNARALNPQIITHKIFMRDTDAEAIEKFWKNLPDYYQGKEEPGIAVVDTSGSMFGTPLEAAIGLGAYIAQRGAGPFKDHFITFSERPTLVRLNGRTFAESLYNMRNADWGMNTNIEAVFDLLLDVAVKCHLPQTELPKTLYILSDMEFDAAVGSEDSPEILIETIEKKWNAYDYDMPKLVFWNLDARHNSIPAVGEGKYSYVSGFSPSMIMPILTGKTGKELMLEKLNSGRYELLDALLMRGPNVSSTQF